MLTSSTVKTRRAVQCCQFVRAPLEWAKWKECPVPPFKKSWKILHMPESTTFQFFKYSPAEQCKLNATQLALRAVAVTWETYPTARLLSSELISGFDLLALDWLTVPTPSMAAAFTCRSEGSHLLVQQSWMLLLSPCIYVLFLMPLTYYLCIWANCLLSLWLWNFTSSKVTRVMARGVKRSLHGHDRGEILFGSHWKVNFPNLPLPKRICKTICSNVWDTLKSFFLLLSFSMSVWMIL